MRARLWIPLLAVLLSGCTRHRATEVDCRAVLDRIVGIELHDLGYRDPVLARRRQRQLAASLRNDLGACRGAWIRDDVAACLARARSNEQLVHDCLH
jgi:hypothetical protein